MVRKHGKKQSLSKKRKGVNKSNFKKKSEDGKGNLNLNPGAPEKPAGCSGWKSHTVKE